MDEDEYESLTPPEVDEEACRVAAATVVVARLLVESTGDGLLAGTADDVECALSEYRTTLPEWTHGTAYAKALRLGCRHELEMTMVELRWHLGAVVGGSRVSMNHTPIVETKS